MKILVTGGAGYLGSVLVPTLLLKGYHVTVLDNFMHRQWSLAACAYFDRFDVVRGDARDESTVGPLVQQANIVIPLAALVGAPACDADYLAAESTNATAIYLLTQIMNRDQRMIIPISNSGYGIGEPGKKCTEDSALRPVSHYGRTKVSAEGIALSRGNAISLRLATVFGCSPRMRLDLLVNDFVHRAMTDRAVVLFEPHFKRNYLHVRDVAQVFLHAIDLFAAMKDNVYNVGLSDANLTKLELCERIKRQVPAFVWAEAEHGKDVDQRDYEVDNSKIEATGYRPKWSIDAGIAELVKGLRMIRNTVHGNV